MKTLLIVGLALAGLGAAVALATSVGGREDCSFGRFDTRAWTDESSADRNASEGASSRQLLADRLIECETLLGARRARVRKVLGDPDNYAAQDTRLYEAGTWSYDLGAERGAFGIDDEHLVLRFGRTGRVRSAELATD